MNEFIPLMVIIPMLCALLVSTFSNFNKVVKIIALIVGIALPIIPLIANYGLHYFGGYSPIVDNVTGVLYHPAITYSFDILQQIFICALGLLTFITVFIFITKYKKASGPYLFLVFMGTASVTAYKGPEDLIDYASTKGAVVTFTRSLSNSLIKKGIRVNAVAPGPIWTPLIVSNYSADKMATFGLDVPMKRAGQPYELAPTYVYLASEDSSYVTGQVLHVNGGTMVDS